MRRVGLLLIGHGSRADGANEGMHRVVEALLERGTYDIVEVGFMIRNFPSIEDGAAACVEKGADTVLLIPYFLHTGLHLIEDLPNAVPRLEKLHPGVRFVLGQPMGLHPKLLEIVEDRISECMMAAEQGVTITGNAILQRGKHLTHDAGRSSPPSAPPVFALAASRAALIALETRRKQWMVDVPLPQGGKVRLPVRRCEVSPNRARCAVVLESGEKRDEASEVEVYAEATWQDVSGLRVELGEGAGVLAPDQVIEGIERAASEVLGSDGAERGIKLSVSVPWAAGSRIRR